MLQQDACIYEMVEEFMAKLKEKRSVGGSCQQNCDICIIGEMGKLIYCQ